MEDGTAKVDEGMKRRRNEERKEERESVKQSSRLIGRGRSQAKKSSKVGRAEKPSRDDKQRRQAEGLSKVVERGSRTKKSSKEVKVKRGRQAKPIKQEQTGAS